MFARVVDLSDQCRQRHMLGMRDLFQVSPEGLFKANAGLVSTNYDGTFNDRGFHYPSRPESVCGLSSSISTQGRRIIPCHNGPMLISPLVNAALRSDSIRSSLDDRIG